MEAEKGGTNTDKPRIGSEIILDRAFPYQVESVLEGGMGYVLILSRADEPAFLDLRHPKHLAAKTFKDDWFAARNKSAFERELNLWISLDVPNIAKLKRIVFVGSRLYALMPVYSGSLRSHLEARGHLGVAEAIGVVLEVLECLRQAYQRYGVLHLDLKPENVLLRRGDKGLSYHVSDWGVARITAEKYFSTPYWNGVPDSFIQDLGVGTLAYMSRERFVGTTPTVGADIYSLGMIVFELVMGSLPFVSPAVKPLEAQVLEADYWMTMQAALARLGNRGLANLVLQATDPDPASRLRDYSALGRALRRLA